jgi:hypothetical protein
MAMGALSTALCAASAATQPDSSREVRPLLETHCVKCHGPEKQKGGLRFDTKEGAFKVAESGEQAIVPGHARQSRLIKWFRPETRPNTCPRKATRCQLIGC